MTTDLTPLRDVFRWARASGWKHRRIDLGGGTTGCQWQHASSSTAVILDRNSDTWIYHGHTCIAVESVTGAVDVLVAVGVLPARFSSAYAAGYEASLTVRNAADAMRGVAERRLAKRTGERDEARAALDAATQGSLPWTFLLDGDWRFNHDHPAIRALYDVLQLDGDYEYAVDVISRWEESIGEWQAVEPAPEASAETEPYAMWMGGCGDHINAHWQWSCNSCGARYCCPDLAAHDVRKQAAAHVATLHGTEASADTAGGAA